MHNTRGIVFHTIKYSDNSLIVKIYTELFGLQSYLVRGVHAKKTKVKSNLFQPMTLLDLVVTNREKNNLQSIKEIQNSPVFISIPYDIGKSSIALFLNEVLIKTIREEEPNPQLFEYLFNSIQILDNTTGRINNFHVYVLVQLSRFLGFYPQENFTAQTPYFDLIEGRFRSSVTGLSIMDKELSEILFCLMNVDFTNLEFLQIAKTNRNLLLEYIIQYYKLHIPSISSIQAHHVLEEVLA